MNCQIRLREADTERVKDFLKEYIIIAERVLIFKHSPPKIENGLTVYVNEHHHIYLFNIQRTDEGIRKYIGHYYEKTKFSVRKTCGGEKKLKITYEGAYQYGTSEELLDPVYVKGFEDGDIERFKLKAEAYYNAGKPVKLEHNDTVVIHHDHHHIRADKVWERLDAQRDKYNGKTVPQIKSMIGAEWLNSGKALPRQCDLHRYALSLYYKLKYVDEVPENALETLYSIS